MCFKKVSKDEKIRQGRVSSPFGYRKHPIYHTKHFHRGNDIVSHDGYVYNTLDGKVRASRFGDYGEGYFIQVLSNINGVDFYANYFHNKENLVKKGAKVSKNDLIAKQGSTGESTGDHIHFEIYTYVSNSNNPFVERIKKKVKHKIIDRRIFFDSLKLLDALKEI